jgi:hypothetical protein
MFAMAERTAAVRVETELAVCRSAVTSLENRAFAVLTLDVAVVTLYLAVRDRLAWDPVASGSAGFWAFCVAVVLVGASVALAASCAVPTRPDDLPIEVLLGDADTLTTARVAQLVRLRRLVHGRTWRTRLAVVLGLAALGVAALLAWWASAGW